MQKDFDRWNNQKKRLDQDTRSVEFHERWIWWCSIGINVGSEQHSESEDFSRPVLIVKRFTSDIFWGVPLTTKIRNDVPFRVRITVESVPNDVLILQMRAYDRKRLVRRIGMVSKVDFRSVVQSIKKIL